MKYKYQLVLILLATMIFACSKKEEVSPVTQAERNTKLFDLGIDGDLILSQCSHDQTKIAFRSDNLLDASQPNTGYDHFYIKDKSDGEIHFIGSGFHYFTWAENSNKFVTLSGTSDNDRYSILKLYSSAVELVETLYTVESGWAISGSSIRFVENDTKVGFLIVQNGTRNFEYWTVDLATKVAEKGFDVFDPDLAPSYRVAWDSDRSHIYFDHRTASHYLNIYKYNVQSQVVEEVLNSGSNESKPALKADDSYLAYLSDQGGELGVWVKNLQTNEKTRLLIPEGFSFDTRYNYLIWIDDKVLVTLLNRENELKLYKLTTVW